MSELLAWKPGDATKLAAFHRQYAPAEEVEAPLQWDAPVQPELSAFDCDTAALNDILEADYFAAKEADAVQHPVPALGSLRKGDCVRVRTSNAAIPFVGRVERLTWDGRVCVVSGDMWYWARLERVTVEG
jgi:hypothetical protein